LSSLHFGVTTFFIRGLCFEPLAFGVALFSSEVFILSPLRFGVATFFIGYLCFELLAIWSCLFFYQRPWFLPNEQRSQ
jgi:hypothetical protein